MNLPVTLCSVSVRMLPMKTRIRAIPTKVVTQNVTLKSQDSDKMAMVSLSFQASQASSRSRARPSRLGNQILLETIVGTSKLKSSGTIISSQFQLSLVVISFRWGQKLVEEKVVRWITYSGRRCRSKVWCTLSCTIHPEATRTPSSPSGPRSGWNFI